jgi:chemotaxis protein CheZ
MLDPAQFTKRLDELRQRYPQNDPNVIAEVVDAVLTTMRGDLNANETVLLGEIEELARTVANARAEIAALGTDAIIDSHIPSATDELDAIVAHTAMATHNILECCEQLDGVASRLGGEDARILQGVTTRIYEACGFQDITGQRITKVVATLKAIEAKVGHIIEVFRQEGDPRPVPVVEPARVALLNGPQLPQAAMDQSDIDALLASFD